MTDIWDKAEEVASFTVGTLLRNANHVPYSFDHNRYDFKWENYVFSSDKFRRAHVEVVDARETKKIWIMHFCIFPHYDDSSPIFGFDIVCGKDKITGMFHDYSVAGSDNHFMLDRFEDISKTYYPNKVRELPEWGKQIFSKSMIAAGNLDKNEFEVASKVYYNTFKYYLANVGSIRESDKDYSMSHDRYCYFQKQNPRTPHMMHSLGVNKNLFQGYMDSVLFPERNNRNG
jgi:hypothetical protein